MGIRIDSASDRVYIAATLPAPGTTGLTVLGWWRVRVDRDDYSAYYRTSAAGTSIHTVETTSTGLGVNIFTPSGEITDTYVNTVDEWVGIAVVDNGSGTVTQYARPLEGATTSNSGTIATGTPDQLCIGGRSQSDATEWFNGNAAHVRVYADSLTQAEIETEWASTTAVLTAWADYPLIADLDDASGNGRHLTAVSGTPVFESGPLLLVESAAVWSRVRVERPRLVRGRRRDTVRRPS
jgi:hypothetical protein